MRSLWTLLCLTALLAGTLPAPAAAAKIKKVLPHWLDQQGLHSPAPSLYERDAYQFYLRNNPEKRGGLRFDIHWRPASFKPHLLRVEARGSTQDRPVLITFSKTVKPKSGWSRWTDVPVPPQDFPRLGQLTAWRVTVWDGETLLAEQRSFLW